MREPNQCNSPKEDDFHQRTNLLGVPTNKQRHAILTPLTNEPVKHLQTMTNSIEANQRLLSNYSLPNESSSNMVKFNVTNSQGRLEATEPRRNVKNEICQEESHADEKRMDSYKRDAKNKNRSSVKNVRHNAKANRFEVRSVSKSTKNQQLRESLENKLHVSNAIMETYFEHGLPNLVAAHNNNILHFQQKHKKV